VPRAAHPCAAVDPVGITSTPVLDRGAGTLYVVGLTASAGDQPAGYRIAALDIKSGTLRPGWPVTIDPAPSSGVKFDGNAEDQRGALLLMRGVVYVPFDGSQRGCGDGRGWIVAVRAAAPRGPQESFAFPEGRLPGVSGIVGIAADALGILYAAAGGGPGPGASISAIRLTTSAGLEFSGLSRDIFAPGAGARSGTSTPLVVPDQPRQAMPHLLFLEDGQGMAYAVNRDDMGNTSRGDDVGSRCAFGTCERGALQSTAAAAYWGAGGASFIAVSGRGSQPAPCRETGGVVALSLVVPRVHAVALDVAWCSPPMRDPGPPSVSGVEPDGSVVWVLDTGEDAALYALDARAGAVLYRSGGADRVGRAEPSATPAVVGGRVYIGAGDRIEVFGLR
jgi:hypothetical protein